MLSEYSAMPTQVRPVFEVADRKSSIKLFGVV